MKKLFLFFVFVYCCIPTIFANFSASGTHVTYNNNLEGINVYVFNGLIGAQITYTDTQERTFHWKKYTCTSAPVDVLTESEATSTTLYDLEDATGYILEIEDGATYRIFVFNYNNYAASVVNPLYVLEKDCSRTTVTATVSFPEMEYCVGNGTTRLKVPRTAILSYKTLEEEWNDDAEAFPEKQTSSWKDVFSNEQISFQLPDVRKDTTTFVLHNDQFSREFGKDSTSLKDEAVQLLIKAWAVVTPRTAKNERNEPSNIKGTQVEGSAPVDVTLTVFTNQPGGFYRWQIFNVERPTVQIGQSTESTFLYTFNEYGTYTARVEVTTERRTTEGERCVKIGSVDITVWISELEVPNVFTPNDDGINDKFCVAYKSIVKYDMWIYNRWGRLVFHSNSPDICWDGYIGNTKAPTGAYFYVIDATGADKQRFRGKKYSGDINLLR